MKEKTFTLEEFEKSHKDSLGFVFIGITNSSDEAIHGLANNLLSWKVSKKLPSFYTRLGEGITAFVFDADSHFLMADFYQACVPFRKLGVFKIDTIYSWLEDQDQLVY